MAERFWERHYQQHAHVGTGRANPVLVDVAEPLPAGAALDLGCAEGCDAIWLAGLGWQVTGVDVSVTALARASAGAAAAGVEARITFEVHDLTCTFPVGVFDLVNAQYLQSPAEFPRDRVLQRAAGAVAPGGLLLVVDHASIAPWSWNQDPNPCFPTPAQTLAAIGLDLRQWDTEVLGSPERHATGPEGLSATVTDNVIALRRRGR